MECQSQVKSFVIRVHSVENDNEQLRIKVKHVQTDEESTFITLEEAFRYLKEVVGE
ncbi:hypothetical protein [Anaerobacillus alkaliphilus]|uniref:hypothetical protein n=1 Tax=Anaerobacillus alkaliphilus TaxID=1548597 RepID=UPI00137611EE|nr:hypothetical protein [Anaerobacillus alkaliphilus]